MVNTLPKRGKGSLGEDADPVVLGESSKRYQRKKAQYPGVDSTSASSHSSLISGKTPRSGSRKRQAMGDAQESLNSLLQSPADSGQPTLLSSSGAQRNTRGRIASPAPRSNGAHTRPVNTGNLIDGSTARSASHNATDRMLAIVPATRTQALYLDEEVHDVPTTRLSMGLQIAGERVQSARDRVGLLVKTDNHDAFGLGAPLASELPHMQSSRRHAARWVTRYATHLVVLVVVGALVAFGGLKALTVHSAFPNGLNAVDAYATDYFLDEGDMQESYAAIESMDFQMTLPRTELGSADAASNSRVYVAPVEGKDGLAGRQLNVRTTVTAYEVEAGDTVESVAAKFDVMAETVMGSNGIWDSEEELAVGRVLYVPPIDGMYYVPREGDTVAAVARKFQADPSALRSYRSNSISGEVLTAGQAIVVPGGMMPMRESAITYVTRKGDTLKKVAARFGVDVPTLMRANSIPDPAEVAPGTSLRILPVAGMEYRTQTGDTVFSVADKFGVSTQMILDFSPNGVSADGTLPVDRLITVPGGSPPNEVAAARLAAAKEAEQAQQASRQQAAREESSSSSGSSAQAQIKPVAPKATPKPVQQAKPTPAPAKPATTYGGGTGSLGWPLRSFVITQYFNGSHNGLDIAAPAGNNIYAAGAGEVIWSGWRTDGLGYAVFIDHGNGLVTLYGHMIRQPAVYVGQYVSRGEIIGYVGSTGRSTGPHTHFMVKSSNTNRNPLNYLGNP